MNHLVPDLLLEQYFEKKPDRLVVKATMEADMKKDMKLLHEKIFDYVVIPQKAMKLTFARAFLAQKLKDMPIDWASYA